LAGGPRLASREPFPSVGEGVPELKRGDGEDEYLLSNKRKTTFSCRCILLTLDSVVPSDTAPRLIASKISSREGGAMQIWSQCDSSITPGANLGGEYAIPLNLDASSLAKWSAIALKITSNTLAEDERLNLR
jgi:hypothetical protein